MPQDNIIDVSGLGVRYSDFSAVNNLSLQVQPDELYALPGANGPGKTSALETIAGHRRPSTGTVAVFGRNPGNRGAVRPRMGIMLQESGFAPSLTVRGTVDLFGAASGRTDDTSQVIEPVDLCHKSSVRVSQLSGGEKRRLDFTTAIYGSPELILLDARRTEDPLCTLT